MGIFDRILGKKPTNAPETLPMVESLSSGQGFFIREENSGGLDEYKGWTFACVRSISEKVGSVEIELKRKRGDKVETVTDHAILSLFRDVNPFMTFFDIAAATQSYLELDGNAFWWLARGKNGLGEPTAIWPLRPDLVSVVSSDEQFVAGYIYKVGNKQFRIAPDQIIHFKEFNPKNVMRGLGTAYAASSAINADNYARMWQAAFFKNGARIDGYLMKEGAMTETEHRELQQRWNDKFKGVEKAHKTPILGGGLKYQQVGTSTKDMDFVNLRTMSRDEILAMFRVPKTVLGVTDGTQTRATAETSEYVFMKETIRPKMQKFVRTLNEFVLPMFGLNTAEYFFTFSDPVPENRELELTTYQNALANGWMSINEVRAKEGLTPVENGDEVMVGFNMQPLGAPKEVPKDIVHATPVGKSEDTRRLLAQEIMDVLAPTIKQVVDMEAFEQRGSVTHKAQVKRGNARMKKLTGILDEFFTDEKKRALESFDSQYKKNGKAKKKKDLLDAEAEAALMADQVKAFFDILVQEEGDAAMSEAGLREAFDARNTDVQTALKKQILKFSGEIADETVAQIRSAIGDGLDAGEAIPDIRKRVEEVSAFGKKRSEVIARTEITRAQNFASVEAWDKSGVVDGKIWYTAEDERVDDECAKLHGEEFGLRANVDPDNDYGKIMGPPLHPNCRCTLIPVVSEKAARTEETKPVSQVAEEIKEMEAIEAEQKETELISAINELDAIERQLLAEENNLV